MSFTKVALAAAFAGAASAVKSDASYFYNESRPLVVAHRGASSHFPEESMPSFVDAYYGGTDFMELDLQITKDGYLIA